MHSFDIYSYLNSKDIAEHCSKINKTWNPFEMAVIIGRSHRSISDKHKGWRELLANYPDMPTPENTHYKSFPSLHEKIMQMIDYQENILALLKMQEPGAIYEYSETLRGAERSSLAAFVSYGAAYENATDGWTKEEMPFFCIQKVFVGNRGTIETTLDYDGNIYDTCGPHDELLAELLPEAPLDNWDNCPHFFDDAFWVDIPTPFKRGDILTNSKLHWSGKPEEDVFILKSTIRDNEKLYTKFLSYEFGDGSDMMAWGYYADKYGVLYGDHVGFEDGFKYYRGKLSPQNAILNYVNLFVEEKIDLPELLTMQCKLLLGQMQENNLRTDTHGCCIQEHLHAKYWISKDEQTAL